MSVLRRRNDACSGRRRRAAWLRTGAVAGGEVAALAPVGVASEDGSARDERVSGSDRGASARREGAHELGDDAVESGALEVQRLAHLADALLA